MHKRRKLSEALCHYISIPMFRTKICGIMRLADAQAAVSLGAEAIGLNFYSKSSRHVNLDQARAILQGCHSPESPSRCESVGVFVNAEPEEMNRIAHSLQLNWVQLHGDEPAACLAKIDHPIQVLRVYRLGDQGLAPLMTDIEQCGQLGRRPNAVLIDAAAPGHYGGTGQQVDWSMLVDFREQLGTIPLILAGGLTPENVAEAIRRVRPDGVDVASGVESAPGVKEEDTMRSFILQANVAFGEIGA